MVQEKISMRKIKEVLRLRHQFGHSHAQIAKSVQLGETTVGEYLERARKANISWPQAEELNDEDLDKLLYPPRDHALIPRPEPDFLKIHTELKRKGVTLQLLWEEYLISHPKGFAYSRFCELYKTWARARDVWMPQIHKAGEKVFVDYAGLTVPIYDRQIETFFQAQIFVGSLGASNYIYTEAANSQSLENWISCHFNMFKFYGGVTEIVVPDNLKTGVTAAHRYEPDCNPTYLEMAQHYGFAVIPARARSPKDKSKVENAVLHVERQILARIRNQQFFSVKELNETLWQYLEELNCQPFQKVPGSRKSYFLEIDLPNLKPLPLETYELARWERHKVNGGYHIGVKGHYYSVPHKYVGQTVEIRYNERTVEMFAKGERIAAHERKFEFGKYSTNHHHRPIAHQKQAAVNMDSLLAEAETLGIYTKKWVEHVLNDRSKHIQQQEKTCLGVLRLSKKCGKNRLEKACQRGLHFNAFSFKSISSILQNGLDHQPLPEEVLTITLPQQHENIRGADYYDQYNNKEKLC